MKQQRENGVLVYIVLLLLAAPVCQTCFHLFPEPSLHGAVIVTPSPGFSLQAIIEGQFQKEMTAHLNDGMGLRSFFIRVNNELQYSLFGVIKAQGVVEGEEGYLFETGYIDAYLGKDFIGSNAIRKKVEQLRFIQDTLASQDITFIVVFAPNKARFYPEKLPAFTPKPLPQSNYSEYIVQASALGVNHFDVGLWFQQIRDSSSYPLITKLGIHWSEYGMIRMMDSLVSQLDLLMNEDIADIHINTVKSIVSRHVLDYDLARGLNLLFPRHQPYSGKPVYTVTTENKRKPRVLTIADSYFWAVYQDSVAASVFTSPIFWYYFREMYQPGQPMRKTAQINLLDELFHQDVVILMGTEFNLFNFGWGFIEKAYASFNGLRYDDGLDEKRIMEFERLIRANPEWLEQVRIKAEQRSLPLDSMIRMDAIYMVERDILNTITQ